MINWNYDSTKYSKEDFQLVPEGSYRVRITKAEETNSKSSGNPMIKLSLEVNGYSKSTVFDYVIFNDNDAEAIQRTNQKLGRIFDSFKIKEGDLDTTHWEGKEGGAYIGIETSTYNGNERKQNRVRNFLTREKVDNLPFWEGVIEPEMVDFDNEGPVPF